MIEPSLQRLHLWIPDLFQTKGGIQVYSAYFLEALQNVLPKTQLEVFLKHDSTSDFNQTNFHGAGVYPLKIRTPIFAAQLLIQGLIHRPNLVITTHLNFTEAAYQLWRLTKTPYWAVAHGIEAWDITRPSLQTALQHADRILAVSGYTRDRLIQEQPIDPNKIVTLPNTFDADRFQVAPKPAHLLERYQLKSDQPVILTVCRLANAERYKGYDQILAALPQICAAIPNIHYVIAGKGQDRARVEARIAELNLQDCVTLAGFVPDEELCDHYNLCDVFAMPSRREGFGIVYLEALACGKPVLGGNQDGAIDALCHGKLGTLVDPDNVTEIAATLIQLLQKTNPNSQLHQPDWLRQQVIETYGFGAFQARLQELLISKPS
jgi:glycosyltransferase involved in cell wall biosynthesis